MVSVTQSELAAARIRSCCHEELCYNTAIIGSWGRGPGRQEMIVRGHG